MTNLVINGVSYPYPTVGDQTWGAEATAWAVAITAALVPKNGGNFILSGDINFGTSFGLIATYFTSSSSNPAAAGVLRLNKIDSINWRNNANSADISLSLNSSDQLQVGSTTLLLNPMTTLGDTIYENATPAPTRLAGNITTTKKFLTQTGNGAISAVPAWGVLVGSDLPTFTGDVTNSGAAMTLAATSNSTLATLSKSTGVAVHGTNTNDAASAGFVGEYVESVVSTSTNVPSSNNQFGDLTSISLTAGDWDVTLVAWFTLNGATATDVEIGIGTATGNNGAGLVIGSNTIDIPPPTSTNDAGSTIPSFRVSLSSTTTIYGKIQVTFSAGTLKYRCRLSARRMR